MKLRHIYKVLSVIILLAALFTLPACSTKIPESTEKDLETALVIGEYEVPFEQYRYFFANYKNEYDNGDNAFWETADGDAILSEIKEKTNRALLQCYATFSLTEKHNIDPDGKDVAGAVEKTVDDYIKNEFGGVKEYLENLEIGFMNDSVFRFIMKRFECDRLLNNELISKQIIKTDDESVMASITGGEFCRAKQILVKNDPGEDPEANRKRAQDALNSASLGVDFDRLVAEYGEDPEMIVNPEGYYFTHNQLIEEFEEAAFALEVGEMSGIVESYLGYHIILRCELDPSYVSVNFNALKNSYLAYKYQAAVEEEMAKFTVKETELVKALTLDDFKY